MCFGSAPKAPEIRYVGPSESDIAANNAALETYRQQSMAQQQQFADALQKQIDQANAQAEAQRRQLGEEKLAAEAELERQRLIGAAETAAQRQSIYGVSTAVAEPSNPQTTQAPKPKDKNKSTLKIAPGATAMSAGTGLNIGV